MTAFALKHNPLASMVLGEIGDQCAFVRTKLNNNRFVFSNGYGAHVHRNNRHSGQYHIEITQGQKVIANPPASRNVLSNLSEREVVGILMQVAAL